MSRRGMFRLWVLASILWFLGCAGVFAFRVYAEDACYRVFTISRGDQVSPSDQDLITTISDEATSRQFCGSEQNSSLITLESKAHEGSITQVSFQWLEADGWSGERAAMIDLLNGKDITLSTIQKRVGSYVHASRRQHSHWVLGVGAAVPVIVLLLALGVIWVTAGFRRDTAPGG
jgi:hypothetical protein